jgi:hypothetical protein
MFLGASGSRMIAVFPTKADIDNEILFGILQSAIRKRK